MTEAEVRSRVQKLIAIHDKHPDTPEGKNALRHALRLIEKYKLQSKPPPQPMPLRGIAMAFRELMQKPDRNSKPNLLELERLLMKLLKDKK